MPKTMSFEALQVGQEIPSVSVDVTEEKIWRFADATKDYNPIHINPEWVRGYQFGSGSRFRAESSRISRRCSAFGAASQRSRNSCSPTM